MVIDRVQEYPLRGRKIGFLGKGGAGKSTALVLLAHAFKRTGYVVTVLDADSTNHGLNQALGIAVQPRPLMELFGGTVFQGGSVGCPVDDPCRLQDAVLTWSAIPSKYKSEAPSGIRYLVAGKIAGQGPGVILLDFKAGFEDSARGVLTGIDHGVVVIDPTTASVQMAVDLAAMIDQIQRGVAPATAHLDSKEKVELMRSIFLDASIRGLTFLLNRIDSTSTEQFLRDTLEIHGIIPAGVLLTEPEISKAWLQGEAITNIGISNPEIAAVIEQLEQFFSVIENQIRKGKTL